MTESPNPVTGLNKEVVERGLTPQKLEQRLLAANKLEELGWAIVRYAQRVQRACALPERDYEPSVNSWWVRIIGRRAEFKYLRAKYLSGSA